DGQMSLRQAAVLAGALDHAARFGVVAEGMDRDPRNRLHDRRGHGLVAGHGRRVHHVMLQCCVALLLTSLTAAESLLSRCVAVISPLRYLSRTTARRWASLGVMLRGVTRSAGSATMTARLFWLAQPKFGGTPFAGS